MVKRFGPVQGAGTMLTERDAAKTIQASALGSTGYVGILERGPVDELITISGAKDLLRKTGGYIPGSLLPDACADFWSHGDGAGTLFLLRATDGTEKKATLTLYDRKATRNQVVTVTAQNGGGWGGRRQTWDFDIAVTATDIGTTFIDAPIGFHPFLADELVGGTITLPGALVGVGASYTITSHLASDGIAKTRFNIASDSDAAADYGAAVDKECYIQVSQVDTWGRSRNLAIEIQDGKDKPSTEWGIYVYENDVLVYDQGDLSSDPLSPRYFVDMINNDTDRNQYITVTDLWSGTISASIRPANFWCSIASTAITALTIDLATVIPQWTQSGVGDNTITNFTYGAQLIRDRYTCTLTMPGPTWALASLDQQSEHVFTVPADTVPYVADTVFSPGFTLTEVTGVTGEVITLTIEPLVEDEAIGGRIIFDNHAAHPASGFAISDNTETTVTISTGDLTDGAAIPNPSEVRLQYRQQMGFGYDGIAGIGTTDFTRHYDSSASLFNETANKGYGLIKFATPGITTVTGPTATTVEKAGLAYAAAKNHQYRYEIPKTVTSEYSARAHVQDTLGRSMYSKAIFPSWAYVSDPVLRGRLKEVPNTGMVHGREALTARTWLGYHKAAAGVTLTLPKIVKLHTGTVILSGEILNPAGLQQIDKRQGNFVIWGDRIPTDDTGYLFAHQRELMSYYEHVLIESFDWLIFAINDAEERPAALAALNSFFLPEWRKRALRGDTFAQAAVLKIDGDNNTDATMALGDMNADITLQLADTIERFNISIGKAGVAESVV